MGARRYVSRNTNLEQIPCLIIPIAIYAFITWIIKHAVKMYAYDAEN